jgi:Fe-S cluster assembly protein SufD
MNAVPDEREVLRLSFERFTAAHVASDPAWLRTRRAAAFARYVEKGPPGPRDEAWRHTPTAPLVRTRFEPADVSRRPDPAVLALVPRDGLASASIVFVNGRFAPELSRTGPAGAGVEVSSLREVLRKEPARSEPWLGRVLDERGGVFSDLNTAFAEDGAVVRIAPGAVVEQPIHVVHLAAPDGTPSVAYLRTIVVAGRGSESRVVESFAGPDGRGYLVNSVTEILVEEGARVDHYKLQREGDEGLHVATLAAQLARDSRLLDHAISLGAALSRSDIDVVFSGEGGECTLDGLFVVDGKRVSDTHSRIDHATPRCTSRQLYKGILDAQARGVFNGLVIVRPGAQKTDAVQTNKNLLLSREALVHSTPQLEIRADDVKCKHGSTTGQLDATALFYLRSRGIGEAAARSLLTWAFASDVLQGVAVAAVRRAAERQLQARLPGVAELQEALS